MDSREVIFNINKQLTEKDLTPLMDVLDTLKVTEDDVRFFCDTLHIDAEKIYFDRQRHPSFFYYDFPVYFDIFTLTLDDDDLTFQKNYDNRILKIKELYHQGNWGHYLQMIQGACSGMIFERAFSKIKYEEQYDHMRRFYVSQYRGHVHISPDTWERAIEHRAYDYKPALPYDADFYTVYRGSGSLSVPIDETYSWTLDLMTAATFAYRSNERPVIYEARVRREDIIDYIDERDEFEVIIQPEQLQSIRAIIQNESIGLYTKLLEHRLIDEFNYYRNTFVKPQHFLMESDLHGTGHTARVLLNTMALSYLTELDVRDRAILANAAIYHDIGRTTDGRDIEHGRVSANQLEKHKYPLFIIDCTVLVSNDPFLIDDFTEDEMAIINLIVTYHAHDDDVGLSDEATQQLSDENRERYTRLYQLFKDADALDRVRFNKVDGTFFHTPHALTLLTFAIRLLHTLKLH